MSTYEIQHPGGILTKIFEPPEQYEQHNSVEGYWGPVGSTIDWCERNYAVSFYVAEFYNSISNFFIFIFAVVGLYVCVKHRLEPRFYMLFAGIVIISIGSTMFHGTLSHIGQQGDETPMIYTILSWNYCLIAMNPSYEHEHRVFVPALAKFMLVFSVFWTWIHYVFTFVIFFQVFFAVLTANALRMIITESFLCHCRPARIMGQSYAFFLVFGAICWISDQLFCVELYDLPFGLPNPQFHAWWHAAVGLSCYVGPMFLVYQRLGWTGRQPVLQWWFGGLLPVAIPLKSAPINNYEKSKGQ